MGSYGELGEHLGQFGKSPTRRRFSTRLLEKALKQQAMPAPRTPPQKQVKRLRLISKVSPMAAPRPSRATRITRKSSQVDQTSSLQLKRKQGEIIPCRTKNPPQRGVTASVDAAWLETDGEDENVCSALLQDDLAPLPLAAAIGAELVAASSEDEPLSLEQAVGPEGPEDSAQLAPSALQSMPGAQFHIDIARGRRAPRVRQQTHCLAQLRHGRNGDSTWCCSVLQRISFSNHPVCQQAWQHWATCAQDIASRHVRNCFKINLWPLLHRAAAACGAGRRSGGELQTVLALAGADCADHEATTSLIQALVVAELPTSRVARVASEDFSSLPAASTRIASQLLCCSQVAHSRSGDVGTMDFVDAYKQESESSQGLVVLIIERADAIPKDILRSTLNSWGCACCDHGVPMIVILALQYPPQSRHELLEGDTLVPLHIVDAVPLFDARVVCSELLECIMEDPQSPLPLPPQLFSWLWDLFTQKCPSVDNTLKALALLCLRLHEAGGPLAPVAADQKSAAQHVGSWWQRVCQSAGPVDALVCSTQPLAAHESCVKRKCKLLATLCPQDQDDSNDNDKPVTAANLERLMAGFVIQRSLRVVQQWPLERIRKLQQDLCIASAKLEGPLQRELQLLDKPGLEAEALHQSISHWFQQLQDQLWQPLFGGSKPLFIASLAQADSATRDVEQQLGCGASVVASACFLPLADCGARAEVDDFTLLYRVLERAHGKSIAVADLWRIFSRHAPAGGDVPGPSLQKRFGLGLVALNSLGYIVPLTGGRQFEDVSLDGAYAGRRVRKRHYGRLHMLRRHQATENDNGSTDLACMTDNSAAVSQALAAAAEGHTADGTICSSSQQQVAEFVPRAVYAGSVAPTFGQQRSTSQSMPQEPASVSAQKRRFMMPPAHGQKRRGAVHEGNKRARVFMG